MDESSRSGCAKQEHRLVFVADKLAQNKLLTDLSLLLSFLDNEFMLFCLLLSHLLAFDSLRILLAERQVGDGHICTISEGTTRLDSICKCHVVGMESSIVCNDELYVSSNKTKQNKTKQNKTKQTTNNKQNKTGACVLGGLAYFSRKW